VGHYLVDAGRAELEELIHYQPSLRARVVRFVYTHPAGFYFCALSLLSLCLLWSAAMVVAGAGVPVLLGIPLLALFVLPVSEMAIALVNAFTIALLPPRRLAKLDFSAGIPAEHRTLVAVPALLDGVAGVDQLIEDLEVRALANPDPHLHFALLTDFPDAEA